MNKRHFLVPFISVALMGCAGPVSLSPTPDGAIAWNDAPAKHEPVAMDGAVMEPAGSESWSAPSPDGEHSSEGASSSTDDDDSGADIADDYPIPPVQGEDTVGAVAVTVKQGQRAPFSGTLLSPVSMARVISQLESVPERIAAAERSAHARCKANYELRLKEKQIELEGERERRETQVRLRDEQISDLNETLKDAKDEPVWLYITGGAVGGALLTVAGALVVGGTK